jgi:hypothetical protein
MNVAKPAARRRASRLPPRPRGYKRSLSCSLSVFYQSGNAEGIASLGDAADRSRPPDQSPTKLSIAEVATSRNIRCPSPPRRALLGAHAAKNGRFGRPSRGRAPSAWRVDWAVQMSRNKRYKDRRPRSAPERRAMIPRSVSAGRRETLAARQPSCPGFCEGLGCRYPDGRRVARLNELPPETRLRLLEKYWRREQCDGAMLL